MLVAVQRAERVEPAVLVAQGVDEPALGGVPALAALGAQPAAGGVREGQDAAVGVLAAGRVEVAAEDPRRVRLLGEVRGDRLVGADLGEIRGARDRRVEVDELEIALAPVLFGGGRRLFENLHEPGPQFRIDKVLDGPSATHLRYVRQ